MQVEEEREKGTCPFPCSLSSLLSMNCRARAQGLSHQLQTQVRYKNQPGVEGTMLVESDGKVRLAASSDGRTYSLDDYNLEAFHKNSELKNLRPIHVVTSEPTLHLCLPPQPVVREEQSPTEQEQDSDVYFDFDLITPPEDYACTEESGSKVQETIAEENAERPESGCVTSVTSPIMFSIDFDLPLSNAPSPLDDGAPDDLNSKSSDVDLETVRQLLVSAQNKTINVESSQEVKFEVKNNDIPDFIGVVKCPNYLKTSSYSDVNTSSSSDCESSSETGLNIPEEEKELISKEKNMSRNISYYLPPPSSYQIFRNKESDLDNNEVPSAPRPKHKTTKFKHKKKKYKTHSPNRNESSESRDSPLLTPDFGVRLSSSPESSSVQSITVRENNKPHRQLIIRSNSFDYMPRHSVNKRIKTSHSFEKCACDIATYSDKEIQRNIQQSAPRSCNTSHNKLKSDAPNEGNALQFCEESHESKCYQSTLADLKYESKILRELSASDIKARLEIEGGQAVSSFNEEDILKEINEAIAILKNEYDDSISEKLAKYENCDVDVLGTHTINKKENYLEQVAVLSHNSALDATDKCQKYLPVSQLCEACEEVLNIAPIDVKDEKCDINVKKTKRCSSYDGTFQTNDLNDSTIESDMPRSKGRSKVKKAHSETRSPLSQKVAELPEGAIFPSATPSSSTSNTDKNLECSKLCEINNCPNSSDDVRLNSSYNSCCALQYNNTDTGNCSVFHVKSSQIDSDVLCENIVKENCFVSDMGIFNGKLESSTNESEKNVAENCHSRENNENNQCASIRGILDSPLSDNVPKDTYEILKVDHTVCGSSFGCENQVSTDCHSNSLIHTLINNNNNNNLIESNPKINTSNYVSSDSNFYSEDTLGLNNELCSGTAGHDSNAVRCTPTCDTEERESSPTFNSQIFEVSSPQNNPEYCDENHLQNFMDVENESTDTKSTTTHERDYDNFLSMPDSASIGMNPVSASHLTSGESSENVNLSDNKYECEVFSNEQEIFSDEIELLPAEDSETANSGKEEEEESDEEILVSSRFRKISTYTERITRLSEDDDGLPAPPTEVILIDYDEPIENVEEINEEKNISDDLASELNKLSLAEPVVEGPSDESERSSEERDIDVELQQKIKRSSSLRCGKTPPGTPGRKKIVRFADALGLDLADIRTFLDGVPTVPPSAFCDLQVECEGSSGPSSDSQLRQNIPSYGSYTAAASAAAALIQTQAQRFLTPMFQQPGALPDFYARLWDQKVILENVSVGNDLSVKGVVRVTNEDFHKKVYIRYTFDHWRNYHEATASYIDGSHDGHFDRFSFLLWGSFLQSNGSLVFCVKYCVKDKIYWDNNRGSNYRLQCYSAPPPHTLLGKPQNDGNMQQHQEQHALGHRLSHQSGLSGRSSSNYSSFMDSPNTPTDPWATKFF